MNKIALVGNPNAGKTSLFNQLTGLNQKVGNFAGVTIERKSGTITLSATQNVEIIDLPGTYSLYPKSPDEQIVTDVLLNAKDPDFPDVIISVVDASNLERNLLLVKQIQSLRIPIILALNMIESAQEKGVFYDTALLSEKLGCVVVPINARTGFGLTQLKKILHRELPQKLIPKYHFIEIHQKLINEIKTVTQVDNEYHNWTLANQIKSLKFMPKNQQNVIQEITEKYNFNSNDAQKSETLERYAEIRHFLAQCRVQKPYTKTKDLTNLFDKIALHPVGGYALFLVLMLLVFQALFEFASYPMDLIDGIFTSFSAFLQNQLPENKLTNLLTDGIIAGIGGVVIFIPQIAILFGLISILEESGYMARVVFMTDKLMQKFGMNGKSIIPLISGMACAIPAIMATRNIQNEKERLLTIFVTPFMSCSARLPIYTIIIGLVIPEGAYFGIFSLQGLALTGLYFLGILAAVVSAFFFQNVFEVKSKSYFMMEIPRYRMPRWKNIGLTMFQQSKSFVLEAGKVILAVSIVLWVLASYAPNNEFQVIENEYLTKYSELSQVELENKIAGAKLEASYAGKIGKIIEPVIRPLGYDWKIGIALLSSFAAREVFVGTMATIYSIGSETENQITIRERMRQEKNPKTGASFYTPALGFSLLVFYAFAMQCMSTMAVVYKETGSWKYPILQLIYMTGLAYFSAFLVYNLCTL